MRTKLKSQKGFSLLENILATVLVSVGLLGGMATMQNASINTMNGDMSSIATQLANEKIEIILADKQFNGYDAVSTGDHDVESFSGQLQGFQRVVTVSEVDPDDLITPSAGSGMKRVIVTVNWGNKDHQKVIVSTLVTDYI